MILISLRDFNFAWLLLAEEVDHVDGSVLQLQRLKMLIKSWLCGLRRPGKLHFLLAWEQTCRLFPEHGYGAANLDIGEADAFWCPEYGFGFHEIGDIALFDD